MWPKLKVWDDILKKLPINAGPEYIIIDATFVKLRNRGGRFNRQRGQSKDGLTTKVHAVVDGLGNPVRLLLTA